jgi:beta-1,4-mannosyl-glycoprotein beta-1,4-N-acetylglucosaminyltransferase|tara:strand:- start:3409 stop:4209 length:801 start_codon:yes stop_codon:yes gene_type:complete
MAIYDCFQYFNEDHMVDLRLNILDKYVDFFIISESTKTHQGHEKKINFDIRKFPSFKKKIKFIVADYKDHINFEKHIGGESPIEQHQRNSLIEGIQDAQPNDLIILSDSDEIPDLTKLKDINEKKKYIAFSQKMFMYKLNLQNLEESGWIGSRITKKKYISSMQEFRNLKFKKYPFWRIDKRDLQIIKGGWHFSYMQTPEDILKKIKSFSHGEFNNKNISKDIIEEKILQNKDIFERNKILQKVELDSTYPSFILNNKDKFLKWII